MKTKRKNSNSIIKALTEAQKFVFAPLAFQALGTMLDLGILDFLDKGPSKEIEIMSKLKLDEYTVHTLLQIGIANDIVKEDNAKFSLTKKGELFLYDDMTQTNFNFVRNVCYIGATEMTDSFKEKSPKGLHKYIGNYPTIYPALTLLPETMCKSWYEFDHYYSDNCFEKVFDIITSNFKKIYDIGGNTGKFEKLCLKHDKSFDITMMDLEINIDKIKNDKDLSGCKFHPVDVLKNNPIYPEIKNSAVLLSQFLDCFSKTDIKKILIDLKNTIDVNSAIYILEPYTDEQEFEGAKYSLMHTSLYFTCMANGVSKMYTSKEIEEIISEAGLVVTNRVSNIGAFDYTLLECRKNAMVSA